MDALLDGETLEGGRNRVGLPRREFSFFCFGVSIFFFFF